MGWDETVKYVAGLDQKTIRAPEEKKNSNSITAQNEGYKETKLISILWCFNLF